MLLFKDIHGNRIDPVNHTLEVIKQYPYAEIHIGTDSQNINKETRYTTVIAYRLGSRGVHYILSKSTYSIIRDMWTRLWMECEKSVEVALYLREHGIEIDTVDLDYNIDPAKKSNKLVKAAVGYVNGFGFKARYKPDLLPGVYAADNIAN